MKYDIIELEGMEFQAFHGCYDLEQKVGNRFIVYLKMEADLADAAKSDDVEKTVNYLEAYGTVAREMAVPSRIIESVADRIADAVLAEFPAVKIVTVKVSKLAPALGGKIAAASVTVCKC